MDDNETIDDVTIADDATVSVFHRRSRSVPQQDMEAQLSGADHSEEDAPAASASPPSPPSSSDLRSRLRETLACVSAIAVPLILLALLSIPAVIIVTLLVGICIVPVIVIVCVGCCFYFLAPETSTSFALLWGSSQNRRWDMDWSLSNYMESIEQRSREDLEKSITVKKVVAPEEADVRISTKSCRGKKDEVDIKNSHSKSSSHDEELANDETMEKEKTTTVNDSIETDISPAKEVGPVQATSKDDKSTRKKSKKRKSNRFNPETMVRLDKINMSCCDICMVDYELDDLISESKNPDCAHIFHKECILDWMQKKHTCPCCRRNYLGEAEEQITTPGWIENL